MAGPGDLVVLGQSLMNVTWVGYVTDIDSPTGVYATMEAVGDEAVVTMDVLQGPRGFKGDNAPIIRIVWDADIETTGDLPPDGGDFEPNDGVWIDDLVYIWTGSPLTGWKPKRPGPAGPRGPVPNITFTTEKLSWEDQLLGEEPTATKGGTDESPQIHMLVPQGEPGPVGPAGPIRLSADYQEPSGGPENLDVITWNDDDGKYEPQSINLRVPRFFSVPEGAFTNFSGVAQRQQVCQFAIPPLPYDWVPFVVGHIRAIGLEVDTDPLTIGAEIRMGNPTSGQLVSRGFGNIATWTTFTPHFSTPSATMDAVSPDGSVARVPANHTGNEGTLYVNLYNDGLFGIYNFNKAGAQLGVIAFPVG